jgi:hypothetical protein
MDTKSTGSNRNIVQPERTSYLWGRGSFGVQLQSPIKAEIRCSYLQKPWLYLSRTFVTSYFSVLAVLVEDQVAFRLQYSDLLGVNKHELYDRASKAAQKALEMQN